MCCKLQLYETINKIGGQFRLPGKLYSYDVITNGNINSTYKATYRDAVGQLVSYIFQRVNTNVFSHPVEIMRNIENVTSYINEKFPDEVTLRYYHTEDGLNYCVDGDCFWRVSNYFDSVAYNTTDDPTVIAGVGEAFGKFQTQLSGFDGGKLYETIPEFHNTAKRMQTFLRAVEEDTAGRVKEVPEEIAYLRSVADEASELSIRYAAGEIPCRVTHNDTKANNVLFDRVTKRPLVVIDLDTVMPGMAGYDFGDAVRFIASTAEEDEPDTTRIYFDTGKFRAFCKGYLRQVKRGLTQLELDTLVQAAFSVTVEMAARFLTDYLQGDTYFKINYPEHNLVRTRSQIRLAQDITKKRDELEWIVRETLKNV